MSALEKSVSRHRSASKARGLLEEIKDEKRTEPIVALTCRPGGSETALDPAAISSRVVGGITIWCLETRALTLALSQEINASSLISGATPCPYNGAAMIWWPVDDSATKVPCQLIIDRDGIYDDSRIDDIVDAIVSGPVHQVMKLGRSSVELVEEKRRRIESERESRRALAENRKLAEMLKDERRERARLKKELQRKKVEGAQAKAPEPFSGEVAARWVDVYMEPGRALPAFSIGPDLESSICECELVDRTSVVDVATRLVAGLTTSLEVHALRTGRGGSDPQRIRPRDGARAFRCAVKRNCPGAPRLHYWKLPQGQIELVQVAHHDNEKIGS